MNIETNNSSHQSIKYRVVAGESQWALIWKRFKKHRLAQISGIVLIFLYTIAAFAEFLSPRSPTYFKASYTYAPPQEIFFYADAHGAQMVFCASRSHASGSI